jgi:hypothetical protein
LRFILIAEKKLLDGGVVAIATGAADAMGVMGATSVMEEIKC